jgi:hypothetical protein
MASDDPTLTVVLVVFGVVGLLVVMAVGNYFVAARLAASEGRTLGSRPKKMGTKKKLRQARARGLQMPTD